MMEDRQFDELVRGTMGNGAEEVPAGLWNAVESSLPAGKTGIVPLWFKWTGAAVAAAAVAAAVALTVILPGRGETKNPVEIVSEGEILAQALPSEVADSHDGMKASAEACRTAVPDEKHYGRKDATEEVTAPVGEEAAPAGEYIAGTEKVTTVAEKETTAPGEEAAAPEEEAAAPGEDVAVPEQETAGTAKESDYDEAGFDEGGMAVKERRGSGFSLTLTGNAASNSNPKISGNTVRRSFRSASAPAPAKSTVVQTDESVFGVPLAAGLGFRYNFNDRWSIGSGVNFTILSRSFAGDYIMVGEDGVAQSAEHYGSIRNNQVYFGVPVYAFCNIITNRVIDFYAYAGGEMDKCIYNKYLLQSATGKFGHEEKYKGLQWSVKAGLGVEFIVTEDLGIFIDPQVGWYFKNSKEYGNIWNYQPLMFGVNLGLRLRI